MALPWPGYALFSYLLFLLDSHNEGFFRPGSAMAQHAPNLKTLWRPQNDYDEKLSPLAEYVIFSFHRPLLSTISIIVVAGLRSNGNFTCDDTAWKGKILPTLPSQYQVSVYDYRSWDNPINILTRPSADKKLPSS